MDGMSYMRPSFTLPVANHRMTDAEYALRVGKITQEEYDRLPENEGKSNTSA